MADRKLSLVLLPGLLCTAALWNAQRAALCGKADVFIAALTRDDSMAGMAETVLESAPRRFALAGLSMGGYVALEIMRRAPDRVTKLALLDTSARADDPARTAEREELLALARRGAFDAVLHRLLPLLIHPDRLAGDPALCEAVLGMAREIGAEAYLRQMKAIMGRPDSRDALPEIRCPTLLLCGAEDARTPPEVHEEMAESIPDARLVVVPHCGHLSTMERPDAVNAALKAWLGTDG
ncbi:MAG: alpha/beta fold hydrolase [Alphaproteobacteria bacterium]|nr:alpha/beta fold hydrolase [Alphaproteobacteria bacterium]